MRTFPLFAAFASALILLGLDACKNGTGSNAATEAVPAAVADTAMGYNGCDHCRMQPLSAHSFDFEYQFYTVRVAERSDTAGQGIVVAPHRGGPLFNVPVPSGSYFAGINREFLFVDSRTANHKRQMIIYDLPGQKEIYRHEYVDTIQILSNGKVWYWEPVQENDIEEAKRPECPNKAEWEAKGLFVEYGQRAIYDPSTLVQVHKSEYKCSAAN